MYFPNFNFPFNSPDTTVDDVAKIDTVWFWRYQLETAALSAFKWTGLPEGIDPIFIERALLYQGCGGFFESSPGTLTFCGAVPEGQLTNYLNPSNVNFVPVNGGQGRWQRCAVGPDADCTVAFDNIMRMPLVNFVDLFSRRLSRMDGVIDTNINAQTTPWIAEGSEQARRELTELVSKVTNLEPVIVGNNGLLSDMSLRVFNTNAPFVAEKVMDARTRELNLFYTLIGIDNQFSTKREREISGEINSNNEQIAIMRRSRMESRQRLAKETNDMFGTDINVEWSIPHMDDGSVDLAFGGGITDDVDV